LHENLAGFIPMSFGAILGAGTGTIAPDFARLFINPSRKSGASYQLFPFKPYLNNQNA
jgi:hypothetical protein